MKLLLDRKYKKTDYTIGLLYVDGKLFCNTIEDTDRGLKQNMPLSQIKSLKQYGITAIPTGTYKIRMDIKSPKYSTSSWYIRVCNGAKVPRLENVPGFDGVLIHTGNTAKDSSGCLIVGKNTAKGMVTQSKDYFMKLYDIMYKAYKRGEQIEITIK